MNCKQGCLLFATADTGTKLANKGIKKPNNKKKPKSLPLTHIHTKDYPDWCQKGLRAQIKSKVSQVY